MNSNALSMILFSVVAIGGIMGGYLTRKIQKFEDKKDDIHVKILPALSFYISYFIKSIETYKETWNFEEFSHRVDEISLQLKNKIISGDIVLTKIDPDKILKFYWDMAILKPKLEAMKNDENLKNLFIDAINKKDPDLGWLKVDPKQLLQDAKDLDKTIKKEFKTYRTLFVKMVILIIMIGIIIGISNYITSLIKLP